MHAPVVGSHFLLRLNVLVERGIYLSTGNREKMKNKAVIEGYRFPFSTPESRIAILAFPRNIPLQPGDLNWDRMARLEAGLKKLPFPCRLLWGAEDIVFPPANAQRFQDLIPNCSAPRMIASGRHFIQEDAPQEIAEEILTLLGDRRTRS
jgi:pimeloyl-ACP methyl ester carboxylesterase